MRLERKLVAGAAVLLLAGGATGAALAAAGHDGSARVDRQIQLRNTAPAAFIRASAEYLGTDAATLRREVKGGRTLADVANSTSGRSAKELDTLLVAAAVARLEGFADRVFSPRQEAALVTLVRRRVTGFLDDTCPLDLAGLAKHMGGCSGMSL
jgi:hypothetical protein